MRGVTSLLDLGSAYFLPKLETLLNPKVRIFNAISIITCPDGYPAEYMRIVDVFSLGEPRVNLKRPPIPQDEGVFSRVVLQIHGRFTGREGVTCHARRL